MSVIQQVLTNFKQNNKIIKTGKDLLMSGELDLTNLDSLSVDIKCYIGKKKRKLDQQVEGNISSLPTYFMADPNVSPIIETHDLLVTTKGEVFIVGAVTLKNDGTTINNILNDGAYLYGDLEIYSE